MLGNNLLTILLTFFDFVDDISSKPCLAYIPRTSRRFGQQMSDTVVSNTTATKTTIA